MKNYLKSQRGVAFIIAISVLFLVLLVGLVSLKTSTTDQSIASNTQRSARASYAAESGVALGRQTIWGAYVNTVLTSPPKLAGSTGNINTFRTYLASVGLADGVTIKADSNRSIGGAAKVDSVLVTRRDKGADNSEIEIVAYGAEADGIQSKLGAVYSVAGTPFKGFDFALLSNQVNCIMCHAAFDNAARYWNKDASKKGTFDRIKIASLENLMVRVGSSASTVYGTLYSRGIVTDNKGVPLGSIGTSTIDGRKMDGSNGHILEPLVSTSLSNTTGSPLPQYGNLYLNYPDDEAAMTDGYMPDQFPSPFADANGNKIVDDAEYNTIKNRVTGALSGGVIYGVSAGSYSGSGLPSTGNLSSVNKSYEGNLILVGTAANPIEITSDIAVNGDVVITGVVKGTGQIYARGNVYLAGDVTYADKLDGSGNRVFGVASDDSKNALALTAGGNIIAGDYLTPRGGGITTLADRDAGDGTTDMSFTMSEVTIFNRNEWGKTQPFLKDKTGTLVANSTYIPGYQPRYYTLGPGDPVYIYNKKSIYWDPATSNWAGTEHVSDYDMTTLTSIPLSDPSLATAAVINLAPKNGWMTEALLKQIWINDESARSSGSPLKVDGLLYTNNSIYGLSRKDSKTNGTMQVNGAIVAADVGLLVPGNGGIGLQLNYDVRMKAFLKILDDSKIMLVNTGWFR